jgi:plastocyanin
VGLLAASAGPASAATVTIRITDRLSDASITVAPGTTVRFVNADDERHRMRSQSGPDEFDSGNLEPGESFSVRLGVVGTYAYLDEREDDDSRYFGRIVVAASGGGGSTDSSGSTGGGSASTATTASVGMAGRSFSPTTVTIAAGGSVTFRNDDDDEHTVTSTDGAFESGTLGSGGSYKRTFASAGTFDYLCAFHSDMTGTVVVKAAGGAAPAPTPRPSPTPTPTAATPTPAEPDAPADVEIEARDFVFGPESVSVPAGTRVTWQNVGVAPHTVTADDGTFDSDLIASGASLSRTFDAPGTFAYLCTFHPDMTGIVEVTAAAPVAEPSPAATDEPATPSTTATTEPTVTAEPPAAVGAESAGGGGTNASATTPGARLIRLPDGATLIRFGFAALIVVAGAVLFSRTIRSSVRAPGS